MIVHLPSLDTAPTLLLNDSMPIEPRLIALLADIVKFGRTCSLPWLRLYHHLQHNNCLIEDEHERLALPQIDAFTLPIGVASVGITLIAGEYVIEALAAMMSNLFDNMRADVDKCADHINIMLKTPHFAPTRFELSFARSVSARLSVYRVVSTQLANTIHKMLSACQLPGPRMLRNTF